MIFRGISPNLHMTHCRVYFYVNGFLNGKSLQQISATVADRYVPVMMANYKGQDAICAVKACASCLECLFCMSKTCAFCVIVAL